ncbi:hypothetical protein NM208_g963 [Fusarium decemcellulare]|uniref:Uncharacterized protein n=1 Tax=Fusarium decemcellulare TaxID=57161 RepID=A0ACC1SXI6_9HYPO|nr:hypothetical protein NM208_g963 [Fusarium decemcellulare]
MQFGLVTIALAGIPITWSSPTSDAIHVTKTDGRRTCTVFARGEERSDVDNIIKAFNICQNHAEVVFPEHQTYWIDKKLHITLRDVNIHWSGEWMFSRNTTYWRHNSYYIPFQNHRAGFIISGDNIHVDGLGRGGIDGNGDVWYDEDKGKSTEGRPMPFVLWNITRSSGNNFYVKQPQFWSVNIMNGSNLTFENLTSTAFSNNAPAGANWVQNADGFNTMDASNITLKSFVYRGGDDCIAIKPRSFGISIDNIVCEGGNGVAIGSLGQYLEDNSVEDIVISNATASSIHLRRVEKILISVAGEQMIRYGWDMRWSVYIKTWMGFPVPQPSNLYENEGKPSGGGWGRVQNLLFSNFVLRNVSRGPFITQDNGDNGTYRGTSNIEISGVVFRNFTGNLKSSGARLGEISCSEENPCFDISFEDMDQLEAAEGKCRCLEHPGKTIVSQWLCRSRGDGFLQAITKRSDIWKAIVEAQTSIRSEPVTRIANKHNTTVICVPIGSSVKIGELALSLPQTEGLRVKAPLDYKKLFRSTDDWNPAVEVHKLGFLSEVVRGPRPDMV